MAANARKVTEKHVGEGDFNEAFEYWTKAAELGDVGSHYELSVMYGKGKVSGLTRKSSCIIWNRLPLVVILLRETILGVMRGRMAGSTEQ